MTGCLFDSYPLCYKYGDQNKDMMYLDLNDKGAFLESMSNLWYNQQSRNNLGKESTKKE